MSSSALRVPLLGLVTLFAHGCELFFPPEAVEPCSVPNVCGDFEDATCFNQEDTFSCTCGAYSGYEPGGLGEPCRDINECEAGPEETCGLASATCTNLEGTFACDCPTGFELADTEYPNGEGSECYDIDECAQSGFCDAICTNTVGGAACESTVADADSPYWRYTCDINDRRYIENPTHFDMDCRCPHTQVGRPTDPNHPDFEAFNRCKAVTDSGSFDIGTGIAVRDWRRDYGADAGATRLNGAYLDADTRTLYVGAQWKDNTCANGNPECSYYGAIIAVDVDWDSPTVGDRTLVSGMAMEASRGTGPTLRAVQSIDRGPDDMLYTVSWESGHPVQIQRIDPDTGDRALVWKEEQILTGTELPANQCHNGAIVGVDGITNGRRYNLQMVTVGQRMTMAPNGDFFLAAAQNGPANGPRGIVRISADGSACEWVTRFAALGGNTYAPRAPEDQGPDYGAPNGTGPRGAGMANFASNPVNLYYREDDQGQGWLYALDGIGSGGAGTRYYRVNVDTGDRENLFSSIVGDSHSVWDDQREVLWTIGGYDTTRIVALDILGHDGNPPTELGGIRCLSTTSTWYACMRGPGDVDNQNRSGAVYDPDDGNLILVHGIWGIVRTEIATGNTYVVSR